MPGESEKTDLKTVFGAAVTITFALEIIALLIILGSIVPHVFVASGLFAGIGFDLELLIALIVAGIGLLIIIVSAAAFIRGNRKLQDAILTSEFRNLTKVTSEAKVLLALFGLAVIFFCSAGFYAYYLLWNSVLSGIVNGQLFLASTFIAIGILLLSLLAQVVIALVGRFAVRASGLARKR